MNAPEDAVIAKAAEALWDSLLGKYKRGEFAECPEQHLPWWHEQTRAVIAAVRDQIAAEALREADAPEVEIKSALGQPTTCRVKVRGVVVFDGVDRSALLRDTP